VAEFSSTQRSRDRLQALIILSVVLLIVILGAPTGVDVIEWARRGWTDIFQSPADAIKAAIYGLFSAWVFHRLGQRRIGRPQMGSTFDDWIRKLAQETGQELEALRGEEYADDREHVLQLLEKPRTRLCRVVNLASAIVGLVSAISLTVASQGGVEHLLVHALVITAAILTAGELLGREVAEDLYDVFHLHFRFAPVTWLRAWIRRHKDGLLCLAGIGAAGLVGVALDPLSDWARYFFSSVFQGVAALTGIALTGTFVSFQLASDQYGVSQARELLAGSPSLRKALSSLGLVLGLSLAGLGVGSLCEGDGLVRVVAAYSSRLLSAVIVFLALRGSRYALAMIGELPQALAPSGVVSSLAAELADYPGRKNYDLLLLRLEDIFMKIRNRPSLFSEAWVAYGEVMNEHAGGDDQGYLYELVGRLSRRRGLERDMVYDALLCVGLALNARSINAYRIALTLVECREDSTILEGFGWYYDLLVNAFLNRGRKRGVFVIEVDLNVPRVTPAILARDFLFWRRVGGYGMVRVGLDKVQVGPPEQELIKQLPAAEATDYESFAQALCDALGVQRADVDQLDEELSEWDPGWRA